MRNINSTMVISSVQKLFCYTEKPINNNNKIGMGWVRGSSLLLLSLGLHCYVRMAVILSGGAWELLMVPLCQLQLLISSFVFVFVCLFLFCLVVWPCPAITIIMLDHRWWLLFLWWSCLMIYLPDWSNMIEFKKTIIIK